LTGAKAVGKGKENHNYIPFTRKRVPEIASISCGAKRGKGKRSWHQRGFSPRPLKWGNILGAVGGKEKLRGLLPLKKLRRGEGGRDGRIATFFCSFRPEDPTEERGGRGAASLADQGKKKQAIVPARRGGKKKKGGNGKSSF